MVSSKKPQFTDFSIDILGRYMCNGLDEALHSIDKNAQRPDGSPQNDARPFNAIIIGGGSFGGVLAQHLFYSDKTNSHRILLLEAGRHALPEHFQNLPLNGQPGEVWGLAWRSDPALRFPGSPIASAADRSSSAAGHRGCWMRRCRLHSGPRTSLPI